MLLERGNAVSSYKVSPALVAKVNLEDLSEVPVFPRETGNRTLVDDDYDITATDLCQPDELDGRPKLNGKPQHSYIGPIESWRRSLRRRGTYLFLSLILLTTRLI